jgi:hypothetical protein
VSLQKIRRVFCEDLVRVTGQAMGVHVVLQQGQELLRHQVAKAPQQPILIGVAASDGNVKRIVHAFQMSDRVLALLDSNRNLVFEIFLGSLTCSPRPRGSRLLGKGPTSSVGSISNFVNWEPSQTTLADAVIEGL